jgi:hypothetical protein
MNKLLAYITISILLVFLSLPIATTNTHANTLCPPNIPQDSRECLDYLRKQLADSNNQQNTLQRRLNNEQYQQLSLQEKITYINNQIAERERIINNLHMEIAAQDVEINLLRKEIQEKEDDISILQQEAYLLKEVAGKRITESYKYSFVGVLELFMDAKNLDNILRKTKYLIETRERDKLSLEDYSIKMFELQQEELLIADIRADLQKKRNDIEEEKEKLVEEKKDLDAQKAERSRLLAESERREKQMIAQLDVISQQQSELDNAIMEYLSKYGEQMANYGWVTRGTWIGRLRNGANMPCSSGTHLHFSIDAMGSSAWHGCGKLNTFGNGYLVKGPVWSVNPRYSTVLSGSMRVPLPGTVILTSETHTARGSCTAPRYAIDITSTLWTNINVYAAHDGNLKKGKDTCGDSYAVIENPSTGIRTAYFHMQ